MKRIILFLVITTIISYAQDENDKWRFSGQFQLRGELDGRDFSNESPLLEFVSLRTRVGVQKSIGLLNFFVQFQDSRVFGEEQNTLSSISNIDLHQGYVELKNIFNIPINIQAGRFEVVYGTERFFGAVGWHYIGRSWDGIRLSYTNKIKLDIFGLTQFESTPYIGNGSPSIYPISPQTTSSSRVLGFWTTYGTAQVNCVDLFGYFESDNRRNLAGDVNLKRFTTGLNLVKSYKMINATAEAAYQFGETESMDISSYLISFKVNLARNWWKIGAGADIISGTDPRNISLKVNAFNPVFGTNHKFYGYMDYFINIPSNTLQLGLNDFYGGILIQPAGSKFSCALDFHHFTSNKPINISNTLEPVFIEIFGQEIDLTLRYNFIEGTMISVGGSAFFPGDLMNLVLFFPREDVAFWSYVMITANI